MKIKSERNGFSWVEKLRFLLTTLIRPFVDFYFSSGLSKSASMAYLISVNIVVLVYLVYPLVGGLGIGPFSNSSDAKRFIELNFLWPTPNRTVILEAPPGFPLSRGEIVSEKKLQEAKIEFQHQGGFLTEGELQKQEFSVTKNLGHMTTEILGAFHDGPKLPVYGAVLLIAFAYAGLIVSVRTTLLEVHSPLEVIPISHRQNQFRRLLYRLPEWITLKWVGIVFLFLPILGAIVLLVLSALQGVIDGIIKPYGPYDTINTTIHSLISVSLSTIVFSFIYTRVVSDLKLEHALAGALLASLLWLGGRWLLTQYITANLVRNLRNLALVPILLTWLYYLCAIFLLGLHIAHTLEYKHLSGTARDWILRWIGRPHRFAALTGWVKLEFLLQLAENHQKGDGTPGLFVSRTMYGDLAETIAKKMQLPLPMAKESINELVTEMIDRSMVRVTKEDKGHHVTLITPPEQIDLSRLLDTRLDEMKMVRQEMFGLPEALFLANHYSSGTITGGGTLAQLLQVRKSGLEESPPPSSEIPNS
ncbi:MAG: YhjD/YihY/BrkB family envelope integrity protein [Planctomycetota bacterium]|nr:YhjD/YihY/BrkB family envelope integrity protein [Planctomycetota bacterium]